MNRVAAMLAAVALTGGLAGCATSDPARYAGELEAETQQVRAANDLGALAASSCAQEFAASRASALVGADTLEHAPMDDVLAECEASAAGENLSRTNHAPDEVVDAWMGSPGHRGNLLDETYTSMGVACVQDGDELLCSQVFLTL